MVSECLTCLQNRALEDGNLMGREALDCGLESRHRLLDRALLLPGENKPQKEDVIVAGPVLIAWRSGEHVGDCRAQLCNRTLHRHV